VARQTVEGLILEKILQLERKVDLLTSDKIPALLVQVATLNQTTKDEANAAITIRSMIWGGITLLVSITGVAVAYFRH